MFTAKKVSYADGKINEYSEKKVFRVEQKIRKQKTIQMNKKGDLVTTRFVNIDQGNSYKIENPYYLKIE